MSIYTRTKSKVEDLLKERAFWCDDTAGCVKEKDIVMSIVGYPSDVEEIYFGPQGIISTAKTGAILIGFTTSSPTYL